MSWIKPILKTLAWLTVPVRIMGKGLNHAKSEIREEITFYETKIKTLVLLGFSAFTVIIFTSLALGFLLSTLLESYPAGFSLIALLHFIILLVLVLVNKDTIR